MFSMLVLDATAKPHSGYLEGNFFHMGHYDECVDTRHTHDDTIMYGKYCLASITLATNSSMFGVTGNYLVKLCNKTYQTVIYLFSSQKKQYKIYRKYLYII